MLEQIPKYRGGFFLFIFFWDLFSIYFWRLNHYHLPEWLRESISELIHGSCNLDSQLISDCDVYVDSNYLKKKCFRLGVSQNVEEASFVFGYLPEIFVLFDVFRDEM